MGQSNTKSDEMEQINSFPKNDSNNDKGFLVIGTLQLDYIKKLEETQFLFNKYEEITGINIARHVAESLSKVDSKVSTQTS